MQTKRALSIFVRPTNCRPAHRVPGAGFFRGRFAQGHTSEGWIFQGAISSGVERHVDIVEVVGSKPSSPTSLACKMLLPPRLFHCVGNSNREPAPAATDGLGMKIQVHRIFLRIFSYFASCRALFPCIWVYRIRVPRSALADRGIFVVWRIQGSQPQSVSGAMKR